MIYLVEDDESIRELVVYTLKSQGFEAKGFEKPSFFWKAMPRSMGGLKMIYLVEDDESIRELVVYTLKSQGFEAKGFEKPSFFWKAMEKEKPELVLLDIMLPLFFGRQWKKKSRSLFCWILCFLRKMEFPY